MKRLLALVVLASLAFAVPASAGTQYQEFGNANVGDCAFAAFANLTKHHDPTAAITTNEVVSAWRSGVNAFAFEESTGFAGERIEPGPLTINNATLGAAVANGGVWAVIKLPWLHNQQHAVAVIGATSRRVEIVTWGQAYWTPRPAFIHNLVVAFAVAWAPVAS